MEQLMHGTADAWDSLPAEVSRVWRCVLVVTARVKGRIRSHGVEERTSTQSYLSHATSRHCHTRSALSHNQHRNRQHPISMTHHDINAGVCWLRRCKCKYVNKMWEWTWQEVLWGTASSRANCSTPVDHIETCLKTRGGAVLVGAWFGGWGSCE